MPVFEPKLKTQIRLINQIFIIIGHKSVLLHIFFFKKDCLSDNSASKLIENKPIPPKNDLKITIFVKNNSKISWITLVLGRIHYFGVFENFYSKNPVSINLCPIWNWNLSSTRWSIRMRIIFKWTVYLSTFSVYPFRNEVFHFMSQFSIIFRHFCVKIVIFCSKIIFAKKLDLADLSETSFEI